MESRKEIINRLQNINYKIFESYKEKAKNLNDSFLSWLADKYEEANYCNYTPAFSDYQKYMNKIIEEKKKEENDAALRFQAQHPEIFKSFQFNKIDYDIIGICPTLDSPDEAAPTRKIIKFTGSIENCNSQSASSAMNNNTADEASSIKQLLRNQTPMFEMENEAMSLFSKNVSSNEPTPMEALNSIPNFNMQFVPSKQDFKIESSNKNIAYAGSTANVAISSENSLPVQNGYLNNNSALSDRKQSSFNNIKIASSVNQSFNPNSLSTFVNFNFGNVDVIKRNAMNGNSEDFYGTKFDPNDEHKFVKQNNSNMKLCYGGDKKTLQSSASMFDVSKVSSGQHIKNQDTSNLSITSVTSSTGDVLVSENAEENCEGKREITEDGAVYSVRCKVYIKKMKMYADHGIAFLFIKRVENKDKCQVVVRSDSATANILVNVLITNQTPIRKMGKNNIMIICHATPESKSLETIIIKVKTAQDVDQLIQNIENFTLHVDQ